MTQSGFSKTRRWQFMTLSIVLGTAPLILIVSGYSRAETKACADYVGNCPACNTTGQLFFCSDPVQGLQPGTCDGEGNNCDSTGIWNCGIGFYCMP